MHSKNYEKIKRYYVMGIWDEGRLRALVGKVLGITAEEFAEITGTEY